jgi:hypothetical protein
MCIAPASPNRIRRVAPQLKLLDCDAELFAKRPDEVAGLAMAQALDNALDGLVTRSHPMPGHLQAVAA